MTTITTKDLRGNMKDAIEKAASGSSIVITMGRGKNRKKVLLSSFQKSKQKRSSLEKLNTTLESENFKKRKIPKALSTYPDLKTFKKNHFKIL